MIESFHLQCKKPTESRWQDWIEFFSEEDSTNELAYKQTHHPRLMWRIKPTTNPNNTKKDEPE
jgi:hypothetical protein